MPLFYFNIRGGSHHFDDPDGTVLEDADEARAHAQLVAGELMRNCEPKVRHWRIEVRDEAGLLIFGTLFASIDKSLAHLEPGLRGTIERHSRSIADLNEALRDCRMSLLRARAISAQAARKPYLVVTDGREIANVR